VSKKPDLIATIISEFEIAQRVPWVRPRPGPVRKLVLPPLLPTGNRKQLPATEKLLDAVFEYAGLAAEGRPSIRSALKDSEWFEVVRLCFGRAFDRLYDPKGSLAAAELQRAVDTAIAKEVEYLKRDTALVVGCWLFEDATLYPLAIGPVRFQTREGWIDEAERAGEVSRTTARRLRRLWAGERPRSRRPTSQDGWDEISVVEAIGRAPIACGVLFNGLSSKLLLEKGLLTARLAMTALSLMWERPSQVLEWMNLLYDGDRYQRHYVLFSGGRNVGSGSGASRLSQGYSNTTADLRSSLERFRPLFDQIGMCLAAYVRPHEETDRPRLMNALFLSLWWYHQACREASDQMAVTKFAASLDALAGGTRAKGIMDLVEARLGFERGDPLMADMRTSKQVIERIYNAGRSRLIHGSSDDFTQDWRGLRTTAESLGRHCLVEACHWLADNPSCDDIDALRRPLQS
jgi:hypothetical protein